MTTSPNPSLLVTLCIDEHSQQYYNSYRQAHFPSEINYLQAHMMLFHNLPAEGLKVIKKDIESVVNYPQFKLRSDGLMFLGRGVAYRFESDDAFKLHNKLSVKWQPWLIPQDRMPLNLHITVQNRVEPDKAKRLYHELKSNNNNPSPIATGIDLWEYLGGPWSHVQSFKFIDKTDF